MFVHVDVGTAQAIVKRLNQWYRRQARPRGVIDHFYRGTRMSYTAAYRGVVCLVSLFMLSIAGALYFVPGVFADKPPWVVLVMKIAGVGITILFILAPVQTFREFTIVNDEGLIKSGLFGRETRLGWQDIFRFQIKPDDNNVIFRNNAKAKLTMSLAYDGWQDFRELAARHLNPSLYWQFAYALANIDAKRPISRSAKKTRGAKWFSFGRKS